MPKIEVKDATGGLLAVFDKEYAGGSPEEYNYDCVKDAEVDIELNGDCTLSFSIPAVSEKLQYLTYGNFIYCDNREFVIVNPDDIVLIRDKGALWAKVQARESWCLLDKRHITKCNDSTQLPINDLDVVITKSGTTAGGFTAGSAGSALSHLLAGSGWSVDVADVTGQHEVRTSQESVLLNVKKVLELWGGYQIWDSINHKLNHRAETWEPYNGYQIKLAKNLQGVTRKYDYDIVTKLWVFGQNDVDIFDINVVHSGTAQAGGSNTITLAASAVAVNEAYIDGMIYLTGGTGSGQSQRIIDYNGSTKVATVENNWTTVPDSTTTYEIKARYLLNFGYVSKVRSSVWRNQDIIDPTELRTKGQEVLDKLAYPRVHYEVKQVDLRTLADYNHETFSVGDLVDVIDEEMNIAVQVRVIRHKYNVFRPWECDISLGDKSYELKSILAELEKQRRVVYRIGRTPSTLVIASAGTSKNTRRADVIVPAGSTSAQKVINQAIGMLPAGGGKIVLLDGVFVVDNSIKLTDNITLEGQGNNTIIKIKDGLNADISVITNADQTNGNSNIIVRSLALDGNKANNSSGIQRGIYFYSVIQGQIHNCLTKNFRYQGVCLRGTSARNRISDNIVENNSRHGIAVSVYSSQNVINNNICKNPGCNSNIYVSGHNNTISNNVSDSSGLYGIHTNGSNGNSIIGNTCKNAYVGIYLYNAQNNVVTGNTVQGNLGDGISLSSSSNNTISENNCTENSQQTDNACDNIFVSNNSDYNCIQSNICRIGSLTNRPRYGINIASSDCDGNVCTNNDLYASGVTGSLNNAGTETIITAGNRL